MRITEKQEVIRKSIEEVPIGIICDYCKKPIYPVRSYVNRKEYNFFRISTSHNDWGNDSIDSCESFDACSPECATKMAEAYLTKSYQSINTREITINHVRSIEDCSDYDTDHDIYGISEW